MGNSNSSIQFSWLSVFLLAGILMPTQAFAAATLGGVIENTMESADLVPGLFTGAAYLFGLVLGVLGIAKLYEHVQNPNQVPIWDSLKRFLAGGAFFALPIVLEAAYETVAAGIDAAEETGFNAPGVSAGGLDAMVARLMEDIYDPMGYLLGGFVYLAGIVFILIGIIRQLKTMQDGVKGPGGIGTIMTFLVGGALLSLGPMMGAWTESMFGTNQIATNGVLQYTQGMTAEEVNHVHTVISAVIAFMMVVGWVSFIRGFFIIRAVSEGDSQASLMAGLTHIFGGALAVNLGPVLNAIQETLDISDYGLVFT